MQQKLITVGVSVAAILVSVLLLWPEYFGLCFEYETPVRTICVSPLGYPYGVALLPFALAFLVLSVLAFAVSRKSHKRWLKFSVGYFVLAAVVIILMENSAVGMAGISLSLADARAWAIILSIPYALISIAMLVISEVRERARRTPAS